MKEATSKEFIAKCKEMLQRQNQEKMGLYVNKYLNKKVDVKQYWINKIDFINKVDVLNQLEFISHSHSIKNHNFGFGDDNRGQLLEYISGRYETSKKLEQKRDIDITDVTDPNIEEALKKYELRSLQKEIQIQNLWKEGKEGFLKEEKSQEGLNKKVLLNV